MTYKNWFYKTLISSLLIMFLVIMVNYFNDPLWVSDHNNFFNSQQQGFNERQQKSNKIFFTKEKYDSVMVGNSKATYINQRQFKLGKLFNYAVSDMHPDEYNDYIEFFKEKMGKPKHIILGIDFNSCLKRQNKAQDPNIYIQTSKSHLYRYKQLLSYDTSIYSLRNLLKNFSDRKTIYDRQNIKIKKNYKIDENYEINISAWEDEAKEYYKLSEYNPNFEQNLSKIRLNNPESNIISIFLPDFSPKFLFYSKSKEIYDQCLEDAKKNSNIVYNFMHFNKSTIDIKNYYDFSHFRPEIGKKIMDNITK
jgi:hypothetical protein